MNKFGTLRINSRGSILAHIVWINQVIQIYTNEKTKLYENHALYLGVGIFKNPYWINSMAIVKIYRVAFKNVWELFTQ